MARSNTPYELRCKVSDLKVGSYLSRIDKYVVRAVSWDGRVTVETEDGNSWDIGKNIVETRCYASDQFSETKQVTRTEMNQALREAGDAVFMAEFTKKPSVPKADEKLKRKLEAVENDPSDDTFKKQRKRRKFLRDEIMNGEPRVMHAYKIREEDGMGRTDVIDMEKATDPAKPGAERKICHRTLKRLVCKGIEYKLKGQR